MPARGSARWPPTCSNSAPANSNSCCARTRARSTACRCTAVPFAVKDNIDVAGRADHCGLSRLFLRARTLRDGGGKTRGGRRHPGRQDQPGPVRHRPGRHAFALRRGAQSIPSRVHLRRIQLRLRGRGRRAASELLRSGPTRRARAGCRPASTTSSDSSPAADSSAHAASCRRASRSIAFRCSRSPCPSASPVLDVARGPRCGSPWSRALNLRSRRCPSASPSRFPNRSSSTATITPGMHSTTRWTELEGLGGRPIASTSRCS